MPTQWGAPIASHAVKDSHTTTPSGTIAKSAKKVIAGSDQRKLGRPTFKPPEPLVRPLFVSAVIRSVYFLVAYDAGFRLSIALMNWLALEVVEVVGDRGVNRVRIRLRIRLVPRQLEVPAPG